MADLTTKQKRFADAYIGEARGNASAAARIAGYAHPEAQSWDVLKNPTVRAYIDERLMVEAMSSAEVLRETAAIARAEWRDFVTLRTDPKTGETLEAKMDLNSKVKSLELLGKYHQLWTDKVHVTGNLTIADLFPEALSERPGDAADELP